MIISVFLLLLLFRDRGFLYNITTHSGTISVDQTGHKLTEVMNSPASASYVLGLRVNAITTRLMSVYHFSHWKSIFFCPMKTKICF